MSWQAMYVVRLFAKYRTVWARYLDEEQERCGFWTTSVLRRTRLVKNSHLTQLFAKYHTVWVRYLSVRQGRCGLNQNPTYISVRDFGASRGWRSYFPNTALFECDIWMKNKKDAVFEQRAYLGVRDLWKNRIWRSCSPNSALKRAFCP